MTGCSALARDACPVLSYLLAKVYRSHPVQDCFQMTMARPRRSASACMDRPQAHVLGSEWLDIHASKVWAAGRLFRWCFDSSVSGAKCASRRVLSFWQCSTISARSFAPSNRACSVEGAVPCLLMYLAAAMLL